MQLTRREFLGKTAAGMSAYCFAASPVAGAMREEIGGAAKEDDRVLVLLELMGGNDGLSTIVPYGHDAYGQNRSRTRIEAKDLLKLNHALGFHPAMTGLKELYDQSNLAIVQGVGYPNPDRSHFKSMDIWHAADMRGRDAGYGWIGRLADVAFQGSQDPNLVVHIGTKVPFSLTAAVHRPIAFNTPESYRWVGAKREVEALEAAALCEKEAPIVPESPTAGGPNEGRDRALSRLRKTLLEAQRSSREVRDAASRYVPRAPYPATPLSGSLATVSALITGGLSTRIYSVQTAGFDTHVNQKATHDRLIADLSASVSAFFKDLDHYKVSDRVVVVAYSEFGRRLAENGSFGTDHGVAGPLFVMGRPVSGGFHSKHPSMTKLDNGDLVHTIDFRQVYASLIDDWIGGNHPSILGQEWKKPRLFQN